MRRMAKRGALCLSLQMFSAIAPSTPFCNTRVSTTADLGTRPFAQTRASSRGFRGAPRSMIFQCDLLLWLTLGHTWCLNLLRQPCGTRRGDVERWWYHLLPPAAEWRRKYGCGVVWGDIPEFGFLSTHIISITAAMHDSITKRGTHFN
eukprot:SAG31_NODE_29_length_32663_cov_14.779695_22_plen_148_part_00